MPKSEETSPYVSLFLQNVAEKMESWKVPKMCHVAATSHPDKRQTGGQCHAWMFFIRPLDGVAYDVVPPKSDMVVPKYDVDLPKANVACIVSKLFGGCGITMVFIWTSRLTQLSFPQHSLKCYGVFWDIFVDNTAFLYTFMWWLSYWLRRLNGRCNVWLDFIPARPNSKVATIFDSAISLSISVLTSSMTTMPFFVSFVALQKTSKIRQWTFAHGQWCLLIHSFPKEVFLYMFDWMFDI